MKFNIKTAIHGRPQHQPMQLAVGWHARRIPLCFSQNIFPSLHTNGTTINTGHQSSHTHKCLFDISAPGAIASVNGLHYN